MHAVGFANVVFELVVVQMLIESRSIKDNRNRSAVVLRRIYLESDSMGRSVEIKQASNLLDRSRYECMLRIR